MIEKAIRSIQKIINYFITEESDRLVNAIDFKLKYLDKEQQQESISQEIIKSSEELAETIRQAPILQSIFNYINNRDFLWESSLIENLSIKEKSKYTSFNPSILEYRKFQKENDFYNEELPYFSDMIKFISLSQYLEYLQYLKKDNLINKEEEKTQIVADKSDQKVTSETLQNETRIKDFKSTLNEKQIEILVECINKIKVLETTMSVDLMKQILTCTTKQPLEIASKKNKLLIYLFNELGRLCYITSSWQAVCAQNKIFLTSEKKMFLNQDNISTTVNTFQTDPPKDSHIIDKYIKELQEH